MIDLMVKSLIRQANLISDMGQRSAENIKYMAVFITPKGSFKSLGVDHYLEVGDFVNEKTVKILASIRMQPSVYVNEILPYKDNLTVQFITTDMNTRLIQEFTAIPLLDYDVKTEGNSSHDPNIEGISVNTVQRYSFQLMEPIFALLRTVEVSKITLLGNVGDCIASIIDTQTKKAIEKTTYKYDGLIMDYPVANTNTYNAIVIPEGTMVKDVPNYLQESEKYGVYSHGLGFYFKQRRWWCYKLYDLTKYETHPKTIDILRLPQDKAPTLDYTFFVTDKTLTILSTGQADQDDGSDIERQNSGVGVRAIQSSLISGETGLHYNNGRGVKTRADSMAEYAMAERGSGNDYIPLLDKPTSNIYKYASANSITDGSLISIPWHRGDPGLLEPGAPLRYMFMGDNERMEVRKGILLGYRMESEVFDHTTLMMKRALRLIVFLSGKVEEN